MIAVNCLGRSFENRYNKVAWGYWVGGRGEVWGGVGGGVGWGRGRREGGAHNETDEYVDSHRERYIHSTHTHTHTTHT